MISAADWGFFEEHGYLKLGRLQAEARVAELCARIDDIMLGRVRYEGMLMQLDGGGAYEDLPEQTKTFKGARLDYRKIEDLELDPLFLEQIRLPVHREACAHVYGEKAGVSVFRAMFMNKPAGLGTELPWHQDGGEIWNLDRDPLLTTWMALDASTRENGCVQIIPGSHRLGLLSSYGHTLSAEAAERHCTSDRVLELELAAGEGVLLHNFLIHRSGINRTSSPRRAFSVCYMDARTRRKSGGSNFFVAFEPELSGARTA